jgi:hypothetical protein
VRRENPETQSICIGGHGPKNEARRLVADVSAIADVVGLTIANHLGIPSHLSQDEMNRLAKEGEEFLAADE